MDKKIIEDYYNLVEETCVNSSWEALYYGLIEEVGELAGIFKRHYRGDENRQLELPEVREKMIKELGDICWYLFAINEYYGMYHPMGELAFSKLPKECHYCIEDLLKNILTFPDYKSETNIISDVFAMSARCLVGIAQEYSISVEGILTANIQKLTSRKERNVLMGEGDDR